MNLPFTKTRPESPTVLKFPDVDEDRKHGDDAGAKTAGIMAGFDTAREKVKASEGVLLDKLDDQAAHDLAIAVRERDDLANVFAVLADAGGPKGIRLRFLTTEKAWANLGKAFQERADLIEKLKPSVRKRLAERRATLTESDVHASAIESDAAVAALRELAERIARDRDAALFCKRVCDFRGVGFHNDSNPDSLYGRLVAPLPTVSAA